MVVPHLYEDTLGLAEFMDKNIERNRLLMRS